MSTDIEEALLRAQIQEAEANADKARAEVQAILKPPINWTLMIPLIVAAIGLIGTFGVALLNSNEAARDDRRGAEIEFVKALLSMQDTTRAQHAFEWLVDTGYIVGPGSLAAEMRRGGRSPIATVGAPSGHPDPARSPAPITPTVD